VSRRPTQLRTTTASGSVKLTAEDRTDVLVEKGGYAVLLDDGTVEVRTTKRSSSLEVRCPSGTDVVIGTASGGVELVGDFGTVSVSSASGSIRTGRVDVADLRTVSGKVGVEECRGRCRVSTKSGTITVTGAGEADLSSVSGRVQIERVDGAVVVRTVSGSTTIGAAGAGPVGVQSISGSIVVRLPPGVRPSIRSSGRRRVTSTCEPGDDVVVDVATVSGSVDIGPGSG
jgi:DUF4097 and DUF4098 domain-containing protein YvlB